MYNMEYHKKLLINTINKIGVRHIICNQFISNDTYEIILLKPLVILSYAIAIISFDMREHILLSLHMDVIIYYNILNVSKTLLNMHHKHIRQNTKIKSNNNNIILSCINKILHCTEQYHTQHSYNWYFWCALIVLLVYINHGHQMLWMNVINNGLMTVFYNLFYGFSFVCVFAYLV